MDLSGLTEHLAAVEDDAALELPVGGRTYRVRPPSLAVGARCTALWASREIEDPAERAKAVGDALAGGTMADLTLGDVVEQMTADGVPGEVVVECGRIALVAWVAGPEAAQRYVDRMRDTRTTAGDASGEARRPASRRRRKSGTSTA